MPICKWCCEEYDSDTSEAMQYTLFCSPECEGEWDEMERGTGSTKRPPEE